jgi:hypothetical protein
VIPTKSGRWILPSTSSWYFARVVWLWAKPRGLPGGYVCGPRELHRGPAPVRFDAYARRSADYFV